MPRARANRRRAGRLTSSCAACGVWVCCGSSRATTATRRAAGTFPSQPHSSAPSPSAGARLRGLAGVPPYFEPAVGPSWRRSVLPAAERILLGRFSREQRHEDVSSPRQLPPRAEFWDVEGIPVSLGADVERVELGVVERRAEQIEFEPVRPLPLLAVAASSLPMIWRACWRCASSRAAPCARATIAFFWATSAW